MMVRWERWKEVFPSHIGDWQPGKRKHHVPGRLPSRLQQNTCIAMRHNRGQLLLRCGFAHVWKPVKYYVDLYLLRHRLIISVFCGECLTLPNVTNCQEIIFVFLCGSLSFFNNASQKINLLEWCTHFKNCTYTSWMLFCILYRKIPVVMLDLM